MKKIFPDKLRFFKDIGSIKLEQNFNFIDYASLHILCSMIQSIKQADEAMIAEAIRLAKKLEEELNAHTSDKLSGRKKT